MTFGLEGRGLEFCHHRSTSSLDSHLLVASPFLDKMMYAVILPIKELNDKRRCAFYMCNFYFGLILPELSDFSILRLCHACLPFIDIRFKVPTCLMNLTDEIFCIHLRLELIIYKVAIGNRASAVVILILFSTRLEFVFKVQNEKLDYPGQ